jgi:hypothetical protein
VKKLALAGLAALALALPANAMAFRIMAFVKMSDNSSCGTCQFIVAEGNGQPWVVATGFTRTYTGDYWDMISQMYMSGIVTYNAYTDHFTNMGSLYHVWARRPCPSGGYSFAQSIQVIAAAAFNDARTLTIQAGTCQALPNGF